MTSQPTVDLSFLSENQTDIRGKARSTAIRLEKWWERVLPTSLHSAFLPKKVSGIKMSHNESVRLVIYQSWYRNFSSYLFSNYGLNIVLFTVFMSLVVGFFGLDTGLFNQPLMNMLIPIVLLILWLIYALFENFRYLKWRLVVTNRRLIFSTPQSNNWMLSDNIEFKGQPRVIDDNWSSDRIVRNLQIFTGSRDLSISPVGLQFDGARVKDGLVMPDVDLDHIEELKQFVLDITEDA
ncbi:MAG: hypothetical protein AB8G95_15240 [Anaerolineae bacterium]